MKRKSSRSVLTKIWFSTIFSICIISSPSLHEFVVFAASDMSVEIKNSGMMAVKSRLENFNNFQRDITGRMFEDRELRAKSLIKEVSGSPFVLSDVEIKSTDKTEEGANKSSDKRDIELIQWETSMNFLIGLVGGWAISIFIIWGFVDKNLYYLFKYITKS